MRSTGGEGEEANPGATHPQSQQQRRGCRRTGHTQHASATRNTQPETHKTQRTTRKNKHTTWNTKHATRNTQDTARNRKHATRHKQHATCRLGNDPVLLNGFF